METLAGVMEGAAIASGAAFVMSKYLIKHLPIDYAELVKAGQADVLAKIFELAAKLDSSMKNQPPSVVFAKACAMTITACWVFRTATKATDATLENGVVQTILGGLKKIPGISGVVASEKEKIYKKLQDQVYNGRYPEGAVPKFTELPAKPFSFEECMATIEKIDAKDEKYAYDKTKLSGAVYFKNKEHADFQTKVYSRFIATNIIHADQYPSVARMDAELISMTASMVKDPTGKVVPCGSVTSGGSESILCAMKASRDWWLERNSYGLFRNFLTTLPWRKSSNLPEIIIADSAHAAYIKAVDYYNLKMVTIRCDEKTGYRLTADAVRKRITANTAIIVVSAPTYPHGVFDDIEGIGKLAAERGIAVHVDACLGGYVIPFAKEAGFDRPRMDFGIEGVTSMSLDTHKYGLAHKGTSVVLYRNKDIRKHQFTSVTDWTGGLYISPTMAGSRSGAVVAAAWASLITVGREGFVEQTKTLLTLAEKLVKGIESIDDVRILGKPDSCLVAFGAKNPKKLDIYKVNDAMTKKGWHLASLQRPAGLHMCLAPSHTSEMIDQLIKDLQQCIMDVKKGPKDGEEGMAPIYGMAESLPDRHIIGDVHCAYQEAALDS